MDPFTTSALTYIAVKVSEKLLDKILDAGYNTGAEFIIPKKTFNARLRVIVQKTSDEFSIENYALYSKMFSFKNSELLFSHLIESNIYNNIENPLTVDKFSINKNIILPDQGQLNTYFEMLMSNILADKELRKLYVEEHYKEAIFEIKESINIINQNLNQTVKNTLVVPQLIKDARSNKTLEHSFNYRQRTSNFIGRENEIYRLMEFFFSDNDFAWWAITGRGGVGKSRLGLEICLELEKLNINCGFLQIQQIQSLDWNNWHPNKPHLFVIDLATNNFDYILNFITYLVNRRDFNAPVKVLLIDRDPDGQWWQKLIKDYDSKRSCFNVTPLTLEGLNADYLIEIINQILIEEKSNIKIDTEILKANLINIDPFQRPLFAMFIGTAIANGQHIRDWNQYNLLDYQLDYELENVIQRFPRIDYNTIYQHKNILILATLCYGLNQLQLDEVLSLNISWLPTPATLNFELYDALSGQSNINALISTTGYVQPTRFYVVKDLSPYKPSNIDPNYIPPIILSPLIPDVLGEYFVLKHIGVDPKFKFRDLDKLGRLKELADKLHSYYYILFVRHILHDFPIHINTIEFLKENTGGFSSKKGINGQAIIEFMQNVYYKDGVVLQKLWEYTQKLEIDEEMTSEKSSFMDDPHRVFQHATLIMLRYYHYDPKNVKYYYDIIRKNTEKFSTKEVIVVQSHLNPMFEEERIRELLINGFASPEDANKYLDETTSVNELIPHLEATAIEFIIKLPDSTELNELVKKSLLERLAELSTLYRDARIKNLLLKAWLSYGPDKIEQFNTKIKKLYENLKDSKKQIDMINAEVEKVSFIKILIENYFKSPSEIRYYFEDLLEHLFKKKPSPTVGFGLIELAKLAYSLCEKYYNTKDLTNGDIFHIRIDIIAKRFFPAIPPPIIDLKNQALSKRIIAIKTINGQGRM